MSEWTKRTRRGVVSFERELDSGVVEIVYPDGSEERFGYGGTCAVDRSPSTARPVSSTRPRVAGTSIREWTGPAVCDVLLMPSVIDEIQRTTLWTTGLDGLESGGWLTGTWVGDAVVLSTATRSNEKRERHGLELDVADVSLIRIKEGLGHAGLVGDWHAHPSGNWRPSPTDFRSWELVHELVNRTRHEPFSVGIIAVPDERGSFAYPELSAWACTHDGDRYVTRPARLLAA